tara:strand:+ start:435 stop:581 length:147 start_codon:yes stop_codon:yes gene_type:complete
MGNNQQIEKLIPKLLGKPLMTSRRNCYLEVALTVIRVLGIAILLKDVL